MTLFSISSTQPVEGKKCVKKMLNIRKFNPKQDIWGQIVKKFQLLKPETSGLAVVGAVL